MSDIRPLSELPDDIRAYIASLPKAELHIHLDGTLEVDDVFRIAERNESRHLIPHASVEAAEAARTFRDLGEFLDEINAANAILKTEQDFYDVTRSYLVRAAAENVRYAEIQVAPRDIPLATVLQGMQRAIADCASLRISAGVIVTLIKSEPEHVNAAVLEAAIAHKHLGVVAIGFAAAEVGYPHAAFRALAERARAAGLRVVSHAGEEGPPAYVEEAVWDLGAQRIDHGVRAIEDRALCSRLAAAGVGLCVCPLSNYRLQVYARFFGGRNPVGDLIRAGVCICINSDDPAFFGGYVNANYARAALDCALTKLELWQLAWNSFSLGFSSDSDRAKWQQELLALKPTIE